MNRIVLEEVLHCNTRVFRVSQKICECIMSHASSFRSFYSLDANISFKNTWKN